MDKMNEVMDFDLSIHSLQTLLGTPEHVRKHAGMYSANYLTAGHKLMQQCVQHHSSNIECDCSMIAAITVSCPGNIWCCADDIMHVPLSSLKTFCLRQQNWAKL